MDLNKLPKQFCDNVNIGFSAEALVLALMSGQNASIFAFSPEHAKRLSLSLAYNLTEYEKKFGEIKAGWTPGVESPIQIIDLNKPKGNNK